MIMSHLKHLVAIPIFSNHVVHLVILLSHPNVNLVVIFILLKILVHRISHNHSLQLSQIQIEIVTKVFSVQ